MKRYFTAILSLALLFLFAGCGGKSATEQVENIIPTVEEPQEYPEIPVLTEDQIMAPNGMVLKETENYGVSTIEYAGTTVPQGLGLPKLTDEEIDALLAENDPKKVKDSITTLADFVNYCYRGKFVFGDGLIFIHGDNGEPRGYTTSSGYQTLQRRIGQCASMCSCLHYVLADDYEEVGYVWIDGHAMAYILCDGLYYLINPAEYATINGEWPSDGLPTSLV